MESYTKECNPPSPTVRRELSRTKLSDLTLIETLHTPYSSIPPHAHESASICLTLTGSGLEIIGGTRIVTQPGGLIIRAPGVIHADQYDAVAHRSFMIEYHLQQRPCSTIFSRAYSAGPSCRRSTLIFLHELGHLIRGQNGAWLLANDGLDERQSGENTLRVQQRCRAQLDALK
ncbi:MAG TPA: AraC family ligand binding domain-containing protein [Pyrinomonadaceae bacterium]|nr:AraC family ligand binding domain-containing protein [Pyrinomonadaceae bacterium]